MRHPCDIFKAFQPKFAAYSKWDEKTRKEDRKQQAILEMVAESGEVLELIQKANRKNKSLDRDRVLDETSDVLWGLVGVMNEFNISWAELTEFNMEKLEARNK